MKKNLLLPALLLFTVFVNAQLAQPFNNTYVPFHQYLQQQGGDIQEHGAKSDKIVFREMGYKHLTADQGGTWSLKDSGSYFYNGNGFVTGGNTLTFAGASWTNQSQFTDNIGPYGPVYTELGQVWNGTSSSYTNSYLDSFTYTNGYFTLTRTYQTWSGSSWTNVFQIVNTYNGNNILSSIRQSYVNSQWTNDTQYVYEYNAANRNTASIMLKGNNTTWDSIFKNNYSYDANNNIYQLLVDTFANGSWTLYGLVNRSFDATSNQLTGSITQLWNSGSSTFVNSYQDRYQYDFNYNNTEYANFTWDDANNTWVPLKKYSYNYNTQVSGGVVPNTKVYEVDATYSSSSGNYVATDTYYYSYEQLDLLGINEAVNGLNASLSPNPVSGSQLNLSLNVNDYSILATNIYDVNGRLLRTGNCLVISGDNKLNISLSGISAGNYYLQVLDKSGKSSLLKFVKQ